MRGQSRAPATHLLHAASANPANRGSKPSPPATKSNIVISDQTELSLAHDIQTSPASCRPMTNTFWTWYDPRTSFLSTQANKAQLSSIPVHLRRYSDDLADFVDSNVDRAADVVRETLSSAKWIPEQIRPIPPPPAPISALALSRLERIQDWVVKHKIVTGVIVVAFGTVAYKGYRASRLCKKTRRAKRARNGGRTEVVVIAGSPTLPLTKSLALDMERRGFIVYIVCNAAEDENMVHTLSRPDIRPLSIDTTDVSFVPWNGNFHTANHPSSPPTPELQSSVSPYTCNPLKRLDPR